MRRVPPKEVEHTSSQTHLATLSDDLSHDKMFLDKAIDAAEHLKIGFDSASGIP